jgi:1-deoxy-D-xylulose-5-phosphate reductoisomerase
MRHAIQYALTYPDRRENCVPSLDLAGLSELTFEEPDTDRFPCLDLAFEALRRGGTTPAILNAANEITVAAFLDGTIGFADIARINRAVVDSHVSEPANDLHTVLNADSWARAKAREVLGVPSGIGVTQAV